MLIGENGLCKTALLQAIALVASGPDRANQLADVPSLRDVRHPDEPAEIEAEFGFGERGHAEREYPGLASRPEKPPRLVSRLWIAPEWKVFQGESRYVDEPGADPKKDPLREARARDLRCWFVAGYGASRTLQLTVTGISQEDRATVRLETLFERGGLAAPNFHYIQDANVAVHYAVAVEDALKQGGVLPESVKLSAALRGLKNGVGSAPRVDEVVTPETQIEFIIRFFAGKEEFFVSSGKGSQGHRSTIAWVSDVIGHQFLDASDPRSLVRSRPDKSGFDLDVYEGLVLLDELDLHLHPSWQVKIIAAIKKTFPKMQFVATTHSPMLLPNLGRDEIVRLRQSDDGDVHVDLPDISPALMTGSEIYESFFGIDRLYPNELGEAVQRYGYLAGNPSRSDEEDAEVAALREKLRAHELDPGWDPVPREGAA